MQAGYFNKGEREMLEVRYEMGEARGGGGQSQISELVSSADFPSSGEYEHSLRMQNLINLEVAPLCGAALFAAIFFCFA